MIAQDLQEKLPKLLLAQYYIFFLPGDLCCVHIVYLFLFFFATNAFFVVRPNVKRVGQVCMCVSIPAVDNFFSFGEFQFFFLSSGQ